jgi:drug/metabolite transporter (DMT)-like permease
MSNAALAGASMSVVASLFASCMFMTAISFYFIFGQKINKFDISGMLIMCTSAVLISLKP